MCLYKEVATSSITERLENVRSLEITVEKHNRQQSQNLNPEISATGEVVESLSSTVNSFSSCRILLLICVQEKGKKSYYVILLNELFSYLKRPLLLMTVLKHVWLLSFNLT